MAPPDLLRSETKPDKSATNIMKNIIIFFKKHRLVFFVVIVLILSIGGGVIGEIITRVYLIELPYNVSPFGNLDFSQGKFRDQGLVISNANNVIVQQDVKIEETINSVSAGLVGIYKKQKLIKSSNVFSPENFYKLSEPAGQGLIITADGWIITALALDKIYADYAVITKDKKIYAINKAVSDSLTDFSFIQVAAKDFPVRKFTAKQDIKKGNLTVSLNWLGLSWISSVAGFSQPSGLVESSENFFTKLILNSEVPQKFRGSAVFNLAGDVLGLANGKGEIEPMAHLAGAANSLFKNKIIKRPSLGINYIDLAQLAALTETNNNWQKGAIIYKDQKGLAVKKNSPADQAGLKEGDIILSVDNINLDNFNSLADIIQNYVAGDKINLVILRAGGEKEFAVTLGEQK